jgi:hypothetical protein
MTRLHRTSLAMALALALPAMAYTQDSLTLVRGTPADPVLAENVTGTVRVGGWLQPVGSCRFRYQ